MLNRLGFEITATGHFHFQNNETEDMLVYQSNEGVDFFSYVNTFFAHWLYGTHFVPRNLGERSQTTHFLILFRSAESSLGFCRREETTQQAAKLQLSIRTKSRTHFADIS